MRYINEKDLKGLKSVDCTMGTVFLQNGDMIHSFGGWDFNIEILPYNENKQVQNDLYLKITDSNVNTDIFTKMIQHFNKDCHGYKNQIKEFTNIDINSIDILLKINIKGTFYNNYTKELYFGYLIKLPLVKFIDVKDSNIKNCKELIFKLEETDEEYNELIELNKKWKDNFIQYNRYE